jgi:hypothetical protein
MRIPLCLVALVALAPGCLGGAGGPPATHPTARTVSVPDVVHPAGDPTATGVSADAAGEALHRAGLLLSIDGPFRLSGFWGEPLVVGQSPQAHARVPAGTPVRLAIVQEQGVALCTVGRRPCPTQCVTRSKRPSAGLARSRTPRGPSRRFRRRA